MNGDVNFLDVVKYSTGFGLFLKILSIITQPVLISDNLISGNSFEKIEITPHSSEFIKLYENISKIENTPQKYEN